MCHAPNVRNFVLTRQTIGQKNGLLFLGFIIK